MFVKKQLSDPLQRRASLQHPGSPTSQGAITVAVTSEARTLLSETWLQHFSLPPPALFVQSVHTVKLVSDWTEGKEKVERENSLKTMLQ